VTDQLGNEDLKCLDGPEGCGGSVEWRTTPDRQDLKSFPRCYVHFDLRMAQVARNLELTSPIAAPWFDPAAAGESWDEE
jgi:hypothetical protein